MEMIAAMQAFLNALDLRLKALEGRPTDPEIAARVAQAEAAILALKGFDQKIIDL
jgi:DNA polymerase III sliding clamp (beta) subunit (PCNA family)